MSPGPIARAVAQCIRLQECADAAREACDFMAYWPYYALPGTAAQNHILAVHTEQRKYTNGNA